MQRGGCRTGILFCVLLQNKTKTLFLVVCLVCGEYTLAHNAEPSPPELCKKSQGPILSKSYRDGEQECVYVHVCRGVTH